MKNKEERKYILEAIRLAKLKENGEIIPMCSIIEILKQADGVVKNLNLDSVSGSVIVDKDKVIDREPVVRKWI